MKALELPPQSAEERKALEALHQTTRDVRLRTWAQMVLLAAEKWLTAPAIVAIMRDDEQTVRRWMKRDMTEGIGGLKGAPKPGTPEKVTATYQE